MKTLEKIKMTQDKFGGTIVTDGAGEIQNGNYCMTQEEIKKMVSKRNTIQYQMQKMMKNLLTNYQ